MQLGELQQYYGAFQQAGVQVYAVSVDPPEHSALLKKRLGAGYEFLSDPDAKLLDKLDIRVMYRSPTGRDAIPMQYLVDRDGIVCWLYHPATWRVRPHPREALAAVGMLTATALAGQASG